MIGPGRGSVLDSGTLAGEWLCALPTAAGLAVRLPGQGDAAERRILPWAIAGELLADSQLTILTAACGDLSPWDTERWFAALAAGDPAARRLLEPDALTRSAVQALQRHPVPWLRLLDVEVLVGDLSAACCRAGLPIPGTDALATLDLIAVLAERQLGQIAVRSRLHQDFPWLGAAAYLSSTGQLAERIVAEGRRREDLRPRLTAGAMRVAELLGGAARFPITRPDVRLAAEAILEATAEWNAQGHLQLTVPEGYRFPVGSTEIACGVGGMHSLDGPGAIAGPLIDLDVASYYPSIIARDGIAPPQLPEFAERTRALLQRRLAAKRSGDGVASTALKFVINSLYGQLGNARSGLFSPSDALRVVLTGQLHLLQLIDGILVAGCDLVSANTDGIVVRGDPAAAATAWEAATGLVLERTPYRQLWRTSVNDYLALAPDGTVAKAKGRFGGGDDEDARRSAAPIVARAVAEHLRHGRPLAEVIADSSSVTDFTRWRRARGLQWDGRPIAASVARWVVAVSGRPLIQVTDHRDASTVERSAQLVRDPATFDLRRVDRAWYLREAQDLADQVLGTQAGARQLRWFDTP